MKIGFIGAGRVGFTLGKYLKENGMTVNGYYSRTREHAVEAAKFTDTLYYDDMKKLVDESDVLFLTVSDNAIPAVFAEVEALISEEKILCHTSGALSSEVFSSSDERIYGYSIHPVYAFSDKYDAYKEFNKAFITVEGHAKYLQSMQDIFKDCGNKTATIDAVNKSKYHAAAVFASNFVCGVFGEAVRLLTECGFSEESAQLALRPLLLGNANTIYEKGPVKALTGPAERCDTETIKKHLNVLDTEDAELYKELTKRVVRLAEKKNENADYSELSKMLD